MLLSLLGIVVGLALLTAAANQFVLGAARLAVRLHLSTVVIGALIIGFGTSTPEMVVAAIAGASGSLDIAVGNIVGSNIANLSLVLGTTALVATVSVRSPTLRREAPISLASVILFAVLVQGGLSRWDGVVFAFALVPALGLVLRGARSADPEIATEVKEFVTPHGLTSVPRESARTAVGLVGTLASAQLLVVAASDLAAGLGLAEGFVGLTVVAVGTSLPELATSLQSARHGETDLLIGNLLGSNLFNSLAVGATAALAGPGRVDDAAVTGLGVVLMLATAVAATAFMATGRRVVRAEGALLLLLYLTVVPYLA